MCGFFGVFSLHGGLDSIDFNQNAILNKIYSRGPDNQTFFRVNNNCVLAHTRLTIIDLDDASNQPVTNDDKSVWIVFNGEIYNYQELKKLNPEYNYKTHGDTEVILALYEKYGAGFVSKLRGMFSILIYDKRTNQIVSIRDRFGIKPLYYYHDDTSIYFSSRVDVLRDFTGSGEFNKKSLLNYFNNGQLYADENTFFDKVYQQPAATTMIFSEAGLRKYKYWDKDSFNSSINYTSYSDWLDYTDAALTESINHHLVADVDVAINLSSGLDSNYLRMFMASKMTEEQAVKCFSFCFDRNEYNECLGFDGLSQDRFNIFKTKVGSSDILGALDDTIRATEGPVGGMGMIAFWLNMRDVRNHGVKVILSGQGADELFAGYKYYIDAANQKKQGGAVLASDGTTLSGVDYINNDYFSETNEYYVSHPSYYGSALKDARYLDLTIRKIPKLLMWQDKLSMAHSVETRVPFLDHVLFESLFHIPKRFLIEGKSTKVILRDVARRYAMNQQDHDYLETTKKYMPTPQREWFKEDFKDFTLDLIETSMLSDIGMVDKKILKKTYLDYVNNPELNNSYFIWKFINIELLYKNFCIN